MNRQRLLFHGVAALGLCLVSHAVLLAQDKSAEYLTLPEIIKKIQPSIVLIITYDKEGEISSKGSGFFVSQTGQIITNRHVLANGTRAKIKTAQGTVHPVTHIITEDKNGDLVCALVEAPPKSVQPLLLSKSMPQVGERVVVIGNPLGLEGTVSEGIISAVRDIPAFGEIIQLTAPISPGSSGSPVVNMQGQVIGIATFQISRGQNLNFAIPARRAAKIAPYDVMLAGGKPKALDEWHKSLAEERLVSAEDDYNKGLAYMWKEKYETAISFFQRATKKNPRYAQAWYYVGYCGTKLGRNVEAVKAYEQAILLEPNNAKFRNGLGSALRYLGRYDEALTVYKEAIRIDPQYAIAHNNLGLTFRHLKRYDEAIAAYKQAILVDADYAVPYNNLGYIYRRQGRYDEAIASYKEAIHIDPKYARPYNNLGVVYRLLGRYDEAIAAYNEVIRLDPEYASAYYNLGLTHLKLGDKNAVQKQYEVLKDLDRDLADKLLKANYEGEGSE